MSGTTTDPLAELAALGALLDRHQAQEQNAFDDLTRRIDAALEQSDTPRHVERPPPPPQSDDDAAVIAEANRGLADAERDIAASTSACEQSQDIITTMERSVLPAIAIGFLSLSVESIATIALFIISHMGETALKIASFNWDATLIK